MGYYDLDKSKRSELSDRIDREVRFGLEKGDAGPFVLYGENRDTYIRKRACLAFGRVYRDMPGLRRQSLDLLDGLLRSDNEMLRQTIAFTLGETGKVDAEAALVLLQRLLMDDSSRVRNGAVGALKQMGQKNPVPTMAFAERMLSHQDSRVRRAVAHGIELRGRTHPEEVLPLLGRLQSDPDRRVRETVVHVLGQISYKDGCLQRVLAALRSWKNTDMVRRALAEIIDVHRRYRTFAHHTREEVEAVIEREFERFG